MTKISKKHTLAQTKVVERLARLEVPKSKPFWGWHIPRHFYHGRFAVAPHMFTDTRLVGMCASLASLGKPLFSQPKAQLVSLEERFLLQWENLLFKENQSLLGNTVKSANAGKQATILLCRDPQSKMNAMTTKPSLANTALTTRTHLISGSKVAFFGMIINILERNKKSFQPCSL